MINAAVIIGIRLDTGAPIMTRNKKLLLLCLLLAISGSSRVFGAFQFDMGLGFPFFYGAFDKGSVTAIPPERSTVSIPLLFNDVSIHYYFSVGDFRVGPGIRFTGYYLINFMYPVISAEYDTRHLRFNATLGGGSVVLFGGAIGFFSGLILIPELSVAWKVKDWFNAGLALTGVYNGSNRRNEDMDYPSYWIDSFSSSDSEDPLGYDNIFTFSLFIRFSLTAGDGI
jgi:hypothetical protein